MSTAGYDHPSGRQTAAHLAKHPNGDLVGSLPCCWWRRGEEIIEAYIGHDGIARYYRRDRDEWGLLSHLGGMWEALDKDQKPLPPEPGVTCAPWPL